jgi:hypothetical protein
MAKTITIVKTSSTFFKIQWCFTLFFSIERYFYFVLFPDYHEGVFLPLTA